MITNRITVTVENNGYTETYTLAKGSTVVINTPGGSINKLGSRIEVAGIITDSYGENNPKK